MRIERIVKGRHDDALHRCAAAKTADVSDQILQWTCQPLRQRRNANFTRRFNALRNTSHAIAATLLGIRRRFDQRCQSG
jgi:hypothetical protein